MGQTELQKLKHKFLTIIPDVDINRSGVSDVPPIRYGISIMVSDDTLQYMPLKDNYPQRLQSRYAQRGAKNYASEYAKNFNSTLCNELATNAEISFRVSLHDFDSSSVGKRSKSIGIDVVPLALMGETLAEFFQRRIDQKWDTIIYEAIIYEAIKKAHEETIKVIGEPQLSTVAVSYIT